MNLVYFCCVLEKMMEVINILIIFVKYIIYVIMEWLKELSVLKVSFLLQYLVFVWVQCVERVYLIINCIILLNLKLFVKNLFLYILVIIDIIFVNRYFVQNVI